MSAEYSSQLLRSAVAGDSAALLKVLVLSRRRLCERIARRIPADLRGTIDADDLVQSTHIEVIGHIAKFDLRDAGAFDRWLMTIALGKLRDALRRHRAVKRNRGRPQVTDGQAAASDSMVALFERVAGPGPTPSRAAARAEAAALIHRALKQLPDQYRRLVQWIYIEGRSVASVAAELGRSEGAIHVACHKARRRLREILGTPSRFFSKRGST